MVGVPRHRIVEEAAKRRSLVTPEGVDLSLRLADVGQRVTAFAADLLLMVAALFLISLLAAAGATAIGMAGAQAVAIVWLLCAFLLRNFYFIIMEMGPRAATYGKRMAGLRVVARSGERLTADRVIARNMMREIEFYLPMSFLSLDVSQGTADALTALTGLGWTGIFLLFPLFNKDRMRVGDLLAGTWVVSAPRRKLSVELSPEAWEGAPEYRFTNAQLDVYGVFELQTLEQVLRDERVEAIATVAATIRGKIGHAHQIGDHDRAFLTAYYDAARARMERGLLFGKRRADKYDKPA